VGDSSNWRSGSSAGLDAKATSLLDRIPGYRGYRDKEGRRDADRLVRESVGTAYDRLATRVEAVGRSLADQRQIADVGQVTDLTDRIRHLANRIRTASYGYSPLFSDRKIDKSALDQLRRFDEGLMSGVTDLEKPVADLESAAVASTGLTAAVQAANAVVRTNNDRLELRGKVMETGHPEPESSVVAVLGPPTSPPPHPAYDLNQGDAVSVLGDDHIVDARIDVEAGELSARFYRLESGPPARWLFAPRDASLGFATATAVDSDPQPAETAERLVASGTGEVSGKGDASGRRPVTMRITKGAPDGGISAVDLDWGNERQRFNATPVHGDDIEIFGASRAT
jgi:hypothetical protein